MDSRNSVSINFNQDLYRWIVKMVKNSKADPFNYSNATFGGFVQACVAKAKKEYEEKGSEIEKLSKNNKNIIACGFLLVIEKPANPSFIHGKVGTVLNVYTKPEYRRQGAAKKLLEQMLLEARNMGLDYVELKSTEAGYFLYKSLGFEEVHSKYHNMQLII